jgi:hypothetical protein
MKKLAVFIYGKCINGGFPLLLMGILWLGLWLFAWYSDFLKDPHWGHNYAESTAFLAVGLAYFNRRYLSDIFALLAAAMIIPTALELLPVNATAIISAILTALIIIDIVAERKRGKDLLQPGEAKVADWLKRYLPCIAYILLASLALTYFLIRVPLGTWETDPDTVVFDALLLPYVALLLIEKLVDGSRMWPKLLAFLAGMLIMVILLIMLADQPETWPVLGFIIVLTVLGIVDILWVSIAGKVPAKE